MNKILKFINLNLAFLWVYQGLIPKLIFVNPNEVVIWKQLGLSEQLAEIAVRSSGVGEIVFGLMFVFIPSKLLHYISIIGLVGLFVLVAVTMPNTLTHAFNPVIMNVAMIGLSIVWLKGNAKKG